MSDQVKIMLYKMEIPKVMRALGKTYTRHKITEGTHPEYLEYEATKDRWWVSYSQQTGTKKEGTGYWKREVPVFAPAKKDVDWADSRVVHSMHRLYRALASELRERTMNKIIREYIQKEHADLIDPSEISE